MFEALVASEHAWGIADQERFGALGREDGWAITDELGFCFSSLPEALAILRPELGDPEDPAFDRLIDREMARRFPGTQNTDDVRGYLTDVLRPAAALLRGGSRRSSSTLEEGRPVWR